MQKIIAIGGGEIGRPGFPIETTRIDKEILRLTNKPRPRLLFIPTASSDAPGYVETVKKYFGRRLGCNIRVLYLLENKMRLLDIKKLVLSSDIIYVGGGNTLKMMNIWRKVGLDKLLILAAQKGIVLSGVSAGAVCWFKYAHSDSRKFSNRLSPYIKVSGLNLVSALLCPHYDFEKARKKSLKKIMKSTKETAIALDNCAALEILGDRYRILTAKEGVSGYRCYYKNKKYYEDKIISSTAFHPLNELLKK